MPNACLKWAQFSKRTFAPSCRNEILNAKAYIQIGANADAFLAIQAAKRIGTKPELVAALTDVVLAQRGDFAAADRLLKEHLSQLQPREAFEAVARCHILHLNWKEIGVVLDLWTSTIPDDPAVSYYRGKIDEATEQFDQAIQHYSKSVELNSRYLKPVFRKALLQRELRKLEGALAGFLSLRQSELESIAMIEVAQCQLELGDSANAWRTIEPFVLKQPGDLLSLYQQVDQIEEDDHAAIVAGQILESLREYEEAVRFLERALQSNYRNSQARTLLIACLKRLARDEEAQKQTSIQSDLIKQRLDCQNLSNRLLTESENFELRCDFAELLFRCKSLGESQWEAENLVRINPKSRRAHQLLAFIYTERSRTNEDWKSLADQHQSIVDRLKEGAADRETPYE